MLENSKAYSGFAVDHLKKAEQFYGETLGLKTEVIDEQNGLMTLHLAGDRPTLVYQQQGATPASYTILNFPVDDIDETVDELAKRGVSFERYEGFPFEQDEKGIARGLAAGLGPDIAWFKDPAGNTISVLQES
jgi:catechol 2,3-dioxygenase-like lactoylglutathione lyase family enzyme